MIKKISIEELKQMNGSEGLVLQGCDGDHEEWVEGINKMLAEAGILLDGDKFKDIYIFEHEGLTNMLFSMEDIKLNVGKLAMWRLQNHSAFGGIWLSDYLTNKFDIDWEAAREKEPEQETENSEDTEITHPLQVYFENVHDSLFGGCTIPLPTTQEEMQSFLDGLSIKGWQDIEIIDVSSDIAGIGEILTETIKKTMSPDTLDELNYLAARLEGVNGYGLDIFAANIEAKRNCGDVREIINLTFTDNINCFDVHPVYNAEQYGDVLINAFYSDEHAESFNRLEKSDNEEDRALAKYIEKLEKHADYIALGKTVAKEEDGVFTERGYLRGGGEIQEFYKGVQDIPTEYRIFTKQGEVIKPILKLDEANVAETIIKLHAVSGCSMDKAASMLKTLSAGRASEYILMINENLTFLCPAVDAYKRGEMAEHLFKNGVQLPKTKFYALRIDRQGEDDRLSDEGAFIEINAEVLRENISRHSVMPVSVFTEMPDGTAKMYDLLEWAETASHIRELEHTFHYSENALKEAKKRYESFVGAHETVCEAVEADVFIMEANTAYMESAVNSQPDMLRITTEAAREILARGDTGVFKLIGNGTERLEPFDAMRPLCFAEKKELAIKREGMSGLDKWAKHKATEIARDLERKQRSKPKNREGSSL